MRCMKALLYVCVYELGHEWEVFNCTYVYVLMCIRAMYASAWGEGLKRYVCMHESTGLGMGWCSYVYLYGR